MEDCPVMSDVNPLMLARLQNYLSYDLIISFFMNPSISNFFLFVMPTWVQHSDRTAKPRSFICPARATP
ncbi:hypothetical protein BDV24DRAFT_37191 [Aspergillus arachidicola]|uniref:Uncharacterized protein n=1 Tax=Aspergillus arachidicola TaxID=656916 RepID=A0A5N6YBU7_9EURO|nr:hypothetical protein BDV24DRAFT_37191 [Aspergillus arachidicola]